MSATPKTIGTIGLSLRLAALRGVAAYVLYLVESKAIAHVAGELKADLRVYDEGVKLEILESLSSAARLLEDLPSITADVLLIGAESYTEADWGLLDRRRSALAREGATVFLTTPISFVALMRVAPNLASWLGGNVFTYENIDAPAMEQREQRLAALRAWSGTTDEEMLQLAENGHLPRDPEYAEWLIMLGRGDLLDA